MAYDNEYNKYQQLYETENQRYSKKGLSIEAQRIRESYEMQIKAAKDSVEIERLKNEELLMLKRVSTDAYLRTLKDFANQEKETFLALKRNVSDVYSDIAKIADDKIGSVIRSQEKLETKLSSYGALFSKNIVHGGGDDGEDLTINLLQDYGRINETLKEYYASVSSVSTRLKESGYAPSLASDFLSAMADMSVGEGLTFSKLLTESSDYQFRSFINGYLENKQLSKDISTLLYSDDFSRAVEETSSYMKAELEKIGFEIPESFSLSGSVSAEKFGIAFVAKLESQLSDIRKMLSDFNTDLSSATNISVLGNGSATPQVTYNQSFNVGTTKESLSEQIIAWKTATTVARLRGE